MRTMTGPALLAARGRMPRPVRYFVLIAAAGELVVDKTRFATDRTDPPALGGRIAAGALTGREIAGIRGLAAGAVAAAAGTYATYRARKLAVSRTGLPDPVVAVGEDIIAYGLSALATRYTGMAGLTSART
jgi:uncharacterized membrane protein